MFKGIIEGIGSYFSVLGFINKHQLHGYFLISGIISLFIGGIIFGASYFLSDDLGALLFKLYPFERWSDYVLKILNVTAGGIVLILGFIIYKYLLLIFVSPFMGPLSAKVESILTGESMTSKFSLKQASYEIIRGIRLSFRNIIRELSLTILLILIGLIPIFTIFVAPLIFLIQSYYAGFSSFDYYLERRATIKQSVFYIKQHRGLAIGNGVGFMLLLLIPILGLFLAPVMSTVAATKSAIAAK